MYVYVLIYNERYNMDILLNLFHKIQNLTRLIFYDFLLLSFSAFIVLQNFFFLLKVKI